MSEENNSTPAPDVVNQEQILASPPTISNDFLSQLPEDLRGESSLANIKEIGSLAKGYVSAQRMLGSSIRIPGPDASEEVRKDFLSKIHGVPGVVSLPNKDDPEAVNEFFNKLGRPTTPEGYRIDAPADFPIDGEQINQFKGLAHKLGLTAEQANAIAQFDIERGKGFIQGMQQQKEAAKQTLNREWGNEFDNNLTAGKEVLLHLSSKYPEEAKALMNGEAGNNPLFLVMAAELGKVYRESGVIQGNRTVSFGHTPTEAKARIQEVMGNPKHAYFNDADPGHKDAVAKVADYYKAAYPSNNS